MHGSLAGAGVHGGSARTRQEGPGTPLTVLPEHSRSLTVTDRCQARDVWFLNHKTPFIFILMALPVSHVDCGEDLNTRFRNLAVPELNFPELWH